MAKTTQSHPMSNFCVHAPKHPPHEPEDRFSTAQRVLAKDAFKKASQAVALGIDKIKDIITRVGVLLDLPKDKIICINIKPNLKTPDQPFHVFKSLWGNEITLSAGYKYFEGIEALSEQELKEFQEYLAFIRRLPEDLEGLLEAVGRLPIEDAERFKAFSKKFETVLTDSEKVGVIAHEIGHVISPWTVPLGVARRVLTAANTALLGAFFVASAELVPQSLQNRISDNADGLRTALAATAALALLADRYARWEETEADTFAAQKGEAKEGLALLFKRRVVNRALFVTSQSLAFKVFSQIFSFLTIHPPDYQRWVGVKTATPSALE